MTRFAKIFGMLTILIMTACQGSGEDSMSGILASENSYTLENLLNDIHADKSLKGSFEQTWKDGLKTCGSEEGDFPFLKGVVKDKVKYLVKWTHVSVISDTEATECEMQIDFAKDGKNDHKEASCFCKLKQVEQF